MSTARGLLLQAEELSELTGVKRGRNGITREQAQIAALKKMKIPHYVNIAGRPVVVRSVVEGGNITNIRQEPSWEPSVPLAR